MGSWLSFEKLGLIQGHATVVTCRPSGRGVTCPFLVDYLASIRPNCDPIVQLASPGSWLFLICEYFLIFDISLRICLKLELFLGLALFCNLFLVFFSKEKKEKKNRKREKSKIGTWKFHGISSNSFKAQFFVSFFYFNLVF